MKQVKKLLSLLITLLGLFCTQVSYATNYPIYIGNAMGKDVTVSVEYGLGGDDCSFDHDHKIAYRGIEKFGWSRGMTCCFRQIAITFNNSTSAPTFIRMLPTEIKNWKIDKTIYEIHDMGIVLDHAPCWAQNYVLTRTKDGFYIMAVVESEDEIKNILK